MAETSTLNPHASLGNRHSKGRPPRLDADRLVVPLFTSDSIVNFAAPLDKQSPSPTGAASTLLSMYDHGTLSGQSTSNSSHTPSPTAPEVTTLVGSPAIQPASSAVASSYSMHELVEQAMLGLSGGLQRGKKAGRRKPARCITNVHVAHEIRHTHPHVDHFLGRNWELFIPLSFLQLAGKYSEDRLSTSELSSGTKQDFSVLGRLCFESLQAELSISKPRAVRTKDDEKANKPSIPSNSAAHRLASRRQTGHRRSSPKTQSSALPATRLDSLTDLDDQSANSKTNISETFNSPRSSIQQRHTGNLSTLDREFSIGDVDEVSGQRVSNKRRVPKRKSFGQDYVNQW
jgi:hypothetical protein